MKIALTGASGFIGRRLIERLRAGGHALHVLGRRAAAGLPFSFWDAGGENLPPEESLREADAVVHLAGEPVAQRWTAEAKRRIRATRVDGTRRLVDALARLARRPAVLACASAIGIYGSRGEEILDESSTPGDGFLAGVCQEWEQAAAGAEALGVRVARLRIGVVLGRDGGALARILRPFKVGFGGRLGNGRQWMSWIHLDDLVELLRFAVETPALRGPVNAVAPGAVTNAEFTRHLAAELNRPAPFPVPAFTLRAIFGEMASVLLDSQRVAPTAALSAGFRFGHPELAPALRQLLG
ncbi:MAG: TIGR01777 family protein [Acidobacteria bacterium]|nr:TIGR01777 family protein [Acidobacteriota bacterium]